MRIVIKLQDLAQLVDMRPDCDLGADVDVREEARMAELDLDSVAESKLSDAQQRWSERLDQLRNSFRAKRVAAGGGPTVRRR